MSEDSDVDARPVAVFGAALLVLLAGTALACGLLLRRSARGGAGASAPFQRLPPSPRLQVDEAEDLARLRRAEDERLNSFGWVDRARGIARVPIDEAMGLAAAREKERNKR